MDIDKLFKVPKLPAGSNKRKLSDNPTPEMLKKMKFDTPPAPQPRSTTVEEVRDEDSSSSTFAPGGDADYFVEEDEEGRFFGGGLTTTQKDIFNIFESAEQDGQQEEYEQLSGPGIRRLLLRFERAIKKNQDQRSKYADDPTKFIESEADLDAAIKALLPLSQSPTLAYPELIRSGTVELLIGLLSHENMDIVIDVVELINELTDEDVGNEGEGEDEPNAEALKVLIQAFLKHSILELLVDNLTRLNEDEESDRQGVFHVLGVFENLLGFSPQLATDLVSKTKIFPWLLNRIQAKKYDENRGYAAEIISIILQNETKNRSELGKLDGVETLLKVISQYRKRDPADPDETEFMENVFDALCSALSEPDIKKLFVEAEGLDLMILIVKEKVQARSRAIKALDYALSRGDAYVSQAFVEALGLKTLFSALMGKTAKKHKNSDVLISEDMSHVLGLLSSLFTNLSSDSPERIRLLAKFVESNYEKVDKLLELRDNAKTRLKATEKEIDTEKQELLDNGDEVTTEEEDLWYLRRLDGGLFTLQLVDYILAWVAMEDDGVRSHLLQMLDRKSQSLRDIVKTLRIYHANVDEEPSTASEEGAPSQKEILQGLISALDPESSQ